jgi:glutamyl-Q tRNA(Asp) synthetase
VRTQSDHFEQYRQILDSLRTRHLLYPCFCSRAEILREAAAMPSAPHGAVVGPLYPGTCRALPESERAARMAAGQRYAVRLDLAAALAAVAGPLHFEEEGEGVVPCAPERFGDLVLARKDVHASYHLCVTHDDALQGVTLVTRGEDLKPATHLHRLLQALMGWPTPRYAHHSLLADAAGRRLAKRDGAMTVRALRAAGHSPREVQALAGVPDI